MLGDAATAIARKVQTPDAIAAQAHADMLMPDGQTRPLSLYLVTVAASGDRNSTADNEALWPIRREEALHSIFALEKQAWFIAHAAWSAERKKIEADRKLGFDDRKFALASIGPTADLRERR